MSLTELFNTQRAYRWQASQSSSHERIVVLKKLRSVIKDYTAALKQTIQKDLGRHPSETDIVEIMPIMEEIDMAIANLAKWMEPQTQEGSILLMGSQSEVRFEARGNCLIIAPWNYPVNLYVIPLISAIAAGNTAILKSSEKTPHTAKLLTDMINQNFDPQLIAAVDGDASVAEALLKLSFDHIFFTGSTQIGKIIMRAAAEHLATVTLELGGKSPVIIDENYDLKDAAEKICWAKFLNAGQTCVAPDYVYVHSSRKKEFVDLCKKEIEKRYGKDTSASKSLARMVDERSATRLQKLLNESVAQGAKIEEGGQFDLFHKYISPTLVSGIQWQHALMQEEIFGPILPILTYNQLEEVILAIQHFEKPLALYIFSKDSGFQEAILRQTTSGGVCINNLVVHLANPQLPFGGVGASGMGNYHGLYGFKTFSHERAILKQGSGNLGKVLYPSYESKKFKFVHNLIRRLF